MSDADLHALIDSMRALGQLQPIGVVERGQNFEICYGHRRWKAARYLRWPTMLAQILPPDSSSNEARKIHENAFREAINPEDEAKYYAHLAEEKKLSIREIADFVNRSPYYIQSRLGMLAYPQDVLDALRNDRIGLGAAEAFADIGDQDERRRLLTYASENGCSARTARAWRDAWVATRAQVDLAAVQAADAARPVVYVEPLFPCWSCEKPETVSLIRTIHLCRGCHDGIVNASSGRAPIPAAHHDPRSDAGGDVRPPPTASPAPAQPEADSPRPLASHLLPDPKEQSVAISTAATDPLHHRRHLAVGSQSVENRLQDDLQILPLP